MIQRLEETDNATLNDARAQLESFLTEQSNPEEAARAIEEKAMAACDCDQIEVEVEVRTRRRRFDDTSKAAFFRSLR